MTPVPLGLCRVDLSVLTSSVQYRALSDRRGGHAAWPLLFHWVSTGTSEVRHFSVESTAVLARDRP
eukprot:352701-Chlamydomonas_euryale.AAC.5